MARFEMSANITVTYKRKRGTSRAQTADGATPKPRPVSSGGVADTEAPEDRADADNDPLNGYDHVRNLEFSLFPVRRHRVIDV